jgi:serine/threonine protein kinase
MRATGDKLDERFIIPIARELAAGLRAIHEAGIIHRDIKAANILIHEEGRLQICDFGVAGVLQSHVDKRSTWIGTPHWMPPEMFSTRGEAHKYGSEVRLSISAPFLDGTDKTRSMCGHMAALSSNSQREILQTQIYESGCKLEGNSTVPHRVSQMKNTVTASKT